jgi:hypothetical protein
MILVIVSWVLNFFSLLTVVCMMAILTNEYIGEVSAIKESVLWIIFTCNIICGMGSGILLASLFSFAALFPWEYTQSVMGGLGLAGALVSVLRILTKLLLVIPGQTIEYGTFISTMVMFAASTVLQFLCMILFYILVRRPITIFYSRRQLQIERKEEEEKKSLVNESVSINGYQSINNFTSRAQSFRIQHASVLTAAKKLLSPAFGVRKCNCMF